jgi:DNA-binding CsgD family transcriptional regulator
MLNRQTLLAQMIDAIGEPGFAAATAGALCQYAGFDLSAVILHRAQAKPAVIHDNFEAAGRLGIENYVRATHRINPMLARALAGQVVRARDFTRPPPSVEGWGNLLIPTPDEELGYRTIGWPRHLEEIGLYFAGLGGLVELGLYRARGNMRAAPCMLRSLNGLLAPIAAAFERHHVLNARLLPREPALDRLSPREGEIARLLLDGCSTEAIALRLNLSRHTVKDHRKQIFRKLSISSLAELFALCR